MRYKDIRKPEDIEVLKTQRLNEFKAFKEKPENKIGTKFPKMPCQDLKGVKTFKKKKIKSIIAQYDNDGIIHGWVTEYEDYI